MSEYSSNLVAVVSGASRGVGRGIATALGRIGATVYVVGRTQDADAPRAVGETVLPGTIHETAALVDQAGGRGIAVACDLANDRQICDLIRRVEVEQGRLDVLVNNAVFIHDEMAKPVPFWERPLGVADIMNVGLRCHYVMSHQAAPLMVRQGSGLIINISFYGAVALSPEPAYGASKAGLDKMAFDMAAQLRPHNVTALSLWPGYVATERVQRMADQSPELAAQLPNFESPDLTGNVIAALARDPDLASLSGRTLIVAELANGYGIREADGRQPASMRDILASPLAAFGN